MKRFKLLFNVSDMALTVALFFNDYWTSVHGNNNKTY